MNDHGEGRLKVLYVGDTWNGSSARAMREGLSALPVVEMEDVGEDQYFPRHRSPVLRVMQRLLAGMYRRELSDAIRGRIDTFAPDVLIVYKGSGVDASVLEYASSRGVLTVDIFPDYSPHAYGARMRELMGRFDLVVSTKPFHPDNWTSVYGYRNECVFVPHGYDPRVHLWTDPPSSKSVDVAIAASWRPQYEDLMVELGRELPDPDVSVVLAGSGWVRSRDKLPAHWVYPGAVLGRAYGEFLRSARIVIAPVHSEVLVNGERQPGDEDSTRTYELAASGCFFVHRRTPYVRTVYDEESEVPMWDDAVELAAIIRRFLPDDAARDVMAARAHSRAVPAYSVTARAGQVVAVIQRALAARASRT